MKLQTKYRLNGIGAILASGAFAKLSQADKSIELWYVMISFLVGLIGIMLLMASWLETEEK